MTDDMRGFEQALEASNPPPITPEREAAADCDGSVTCPAAQRFDALHPASCLGVYRTDGEMAAGIVPSVVELRRRMWNEATVRTLMRRERPGGG